MKNFIQYIDSTYSVKFLDLGQGPTYIVSGIDDSFFVTAVYINNKRMVGVSLGDDQNLFSLSVVNDLSITDLNTIPLNQFYASQTVLILSFSSASANVVSIENTIALRNERFLKVYNLPQYRHDGRFTKSRTGLSYNPQLYALMSVGTIQQSTNTYVSDYLPYKNSIDLSLPVYQGGSVDIPDAYLNKGQTRIILNNDSFQFGDFFIKVNKLNGVFGYGERFYILSDVRTNEFWLYYASLNRNGENVIFEFDLQTLRPISGGFKVGFIDSNVEISISNIYG